MTVNAQKAFEYETEFLSAMEMNFEAAKGRHFRGTSWQALRYDDTDGLRARLASNRIFDRELLKSLPANRRIKLAGFERWMGLWKRRTGVAVASVLSPLSHYAKSTDEPAPPIGLGELAAHVRELVSDANVPYIIGVCSPSGFTDGARDVRLEMPDVTVVLIEPDGRGGWRVHETGEHVDPRVRTIFDPESDEQKAERIRRHIEESSADLLTGGLSVSSLARESGLSEELVRQGFEAVAASDPELHLARTEGELLLFRGASSKREERRSMSMIDRLRQMFAGDGEETTKINALAERRAALAQRRDRIYEDIAKLEHKEADLLRQGKETTSAVPKRRLAAQLAQVRKDVARQNTVAAMLNQQINVLSTDIHNLTLIQQGDMGKLPDTAELTENAVKAEEMLETLKADADMVGTLENEMGESLTSDEELAILEEFEGRPEAAPPATTAPPASEPPEPERAAEAPANAESYEPPTPQPEEKHKRGDAEAS